MFNLFSNYCGVLYEKWIVFLEKFEYFWRQIQFSQLYEEDDVFIVSPRERCGSRSRLPISAQKEKINGRRNVFFFKNGR